MATKPKTSTTEVKGNLDEVRQEAEKTLQETGSSLKDNVSSLADDLKQQGNESLNSVTNQVADQVRGIANAFGETERKLSDENQGQLADYSGNLKSSINSVADYLETSEPADLVSDLESFGRKQPVLFLAGAAALGFAASRFFRSSSERS